MTNYMEQKMKGSGDSNNSLYRTKDLYLASLIYASNERLVKMESGGKHYIFVFQDSERCEAIASSYWQNVCLINAKAFTDAIRTLKDLIFSA